MSQAPAAMLGPDASQGLDASRSAVGRLRLAALIVVIIGVLALAAAAFVLSYTGMRDTALSAGVAPRLARIYPMIFDAVLVVAFAAAISLHAARWWLRLYAWLSVLIIVAAVAAADSVHAMAVQIPKRPLEATGAIVPWVVLLIGFTLLYAMARQAWPRRKVVRAPAGGPAPETAQPPMAMLAAVRTRAALPAAPERPAAEPVQDTDEHAPAAQNAQTAGERPPEQENTQAAEEAAVTAATTGPAGTTAGPAAATAAPAAATTSPAAATAASAGTTDSTAGPVATAGPAGTTAGTTAGPAAATTATPDTAGTTAASAATTGETAEQATAAGYRDSPSRVTLSELLTPRADPSAGSYSQLVESPAVRRAVERDDPSDADAEPAPHFNRLRSTPTPPEEEPWIVETSDE